MKNIIVYERGENVKGDRCPAATETVLLLTTEPAVAFSKYLDAHMTHSIGVSRRFFPNYVFWAKTYKKQVFWSIIDNF